MTVFDPYKTLGVGHKASDDEIRRAYRNLAKKYHPDKNKSTNAEEKFKEIGAAYNLLKDVEKRRLYDMQRAEDEEKTTNAGGNCQQSTYRSASAHQPGSAHQTHFRSTGQKFGPRTFTFTFTMFDGDSSDDEDFEGFFNASFNNEQKANAGNKSGNRSSTWHERAKGAGRADQPFGERPEWDGIWNGAPQANFFRDFDSFFGKQISDMNHMLSDLLGESPLFKFRGDDGFLDDDFFFTALGGRAREPSMRSRRPTLEDMWDWSIPMFRRRKNDPFASFEDSDDDVTDVRFPCVYCGKEVSGSDLSAHEAACKRFHGDSGVNVNPDSFEYSSSANGNAPKPETSDDKKKHRRGNSANARFRDEENANQSHQKPCDSSNRPEENGYVMCPWCEKEFHRSIALNHVTACELLSTLPGRTSHVPPGTRQQNASRPTSKSQQGRQANEKKTSEPSFENAGSARAQATRRSSSKQAHNSNSPAEHPAGRRFTDEPFVMSGSGLHTRRSSTNQRPSKPSHSTRHNIGDILRGKTIYFTKV